MRDPIGAVRLAGGVLLAFVLFTTSALADQTQLPKWGVPVFQCIRRQTQTIQVQLDRIIEVVRRGHFLGPLKKCPGF